MKLFIKRLLVGPIIFISLMGIIYIFNGITNLLNSLSENAVENILYGSFVIFLLLFGFIFNFPPAQKNGDQEKIYY